MTRWQDDPCSGIDVPQWASVQLPEIFRGLSICFATALTFHQRSLPAWNIWLAFCGTTNSSRRKISPRKSGRSAVRTHSFPSVLPIDVVSEGAIVKSCV